MPESRPRRPLADGLSRACFDGDLASVQQYLAEGADLLAPRPARGPAKQCMDSTDSVFLAIHDCSLFARADCLRALVATGNLAQLDQATYTSKPRSYGYSMDLTPLMILFRDAVVALHPPLVYRYRHPPGDVLACVRILINAGASFDYKATRDDNYIRHVMNACLSRTVDNNTTIGWDVFDYARELGNRDIVNVLEEAARLRYSRKTHRKHPRPARYAAAELLRLGYQVGSGALVPVWSDHVLPLLVTRTSRPLYPWSVEGYARELGNDGATGTQ